MHNVCNAPPTSSLTQKANAKAHDGRSAITAYTGCSNGARSAPNRSMEINQTD